MDELDRHRPFPDRGCDALDRTVSHVPGEERSGLARFQEIRVALQLPPIPFAVEDVAAGYKESVVVPKKPSLRAQGGRHPADEDEQRVGRKLVLLAACGVAQDNAFELAVAAHPSHARARTDLDPRMVLAAFD